jgi:tetratricopeptide (TPR) repeat protein
VLLSSPFFPSYHFLSSCLLSSCILVCRVSIRLLYITAKYWTPTLEEVVASFFAAVKRLWPQEGYMVDILRAEMHCHYSLKTLPPSLPNPCETLLKILRAIQEDKKLEDSRRTCVVAEILIAIQLLSHDLSPLTTSAREGDSKDYSVFFPSSGRRVTRRAVNNDAVLDASVRMKMLEQSYTSIPASFIKAKAAYVIGHHYMNQEGNPQLAERILFESIFILDQWQEQERDHDGEDEEDFDLESEEYWDDDFQGEEEQMYVQRLFGGVPIGMVLLCSGGSSPVVSQLGSNALVAFGESLLCNYKYKYAILAFNACITNHHMRRKKEYFSLLERMALLSRENEDFRRSINYYREILQKYKEEKKVHEVIYVSEILSSIFAEMGKLQIAESYLLDALSILPKGSTRVDPVVFQLQLKLARLYIEGLAFDKGVHHLELLRENTSTLPKDKRNSVVSLLAEAYTKKKWFKDSICLLTKELDRDPTTDAPTVTPIRKRSSTPNPLGALPKSPVSSPFARGQKEPSLMYWELSASNYYHAQEFPQAIFCIDYAISLCSAQSLNARGRLCYLRGKIFQSICLYAETIHFPTNFKPKKLRLPEEFVMATSTPGPGQIQLKPLDFSTIYTCKGDLIQECISTYTRAYSYFSAVGDDIRIARTVSRIAETYLDHFFPQVALQEKIIEDINTLPPFTPSPIAQERKAGVPEPAKEPFVINLARIVSPAELGLEVSADTAHPMLLLKSYMNMAELRFLQGKKSVAKVRKSSFSLS